MPALTFKELEPNTPGRARYLATLQDPAVTITMAVGPPGTGKTTLAVLEALRMLKCGAVKKILLTRPDFFTKRSGEDEANFFARLNKPALDAIDDIAGAGTATALQRAGKLELMGFTELRGLTITDAFVLADEVQNASTRQVGTLCTRMGEGKCKLVFTGDPNQEDQTKANWANTGWLGWLPDFEPRAETPDAYPDPSCRVARLECEDVVRSGAAKFAAEIMQNRLRNEAEAEPQTRGGGFAANALGTHLRTQGGTSAAPQPAAQLPDGWEETHDEKGKVYYFNRQTNDSRWAKPTA